VHKIEPTSSSSGKPGALNWMVFSPAAKPSGKAKMAQSISSARVSINLTAKELWDSSISAPSSAK
jgi:hypothetical protein